MKAKKYIIAVLIMAAVYFGVSYLFTLIFKQEFNWIQRIISAFVFGVVIVLVQYFLSKKKRKK
jgi:FtsH-binding integral membrane protein